jgi:protein arginine kinase activator
MKCQKCGKNSVNFHYSSNVNGLVTETHLCSACAAEEGYNLGSFAGLEQIFNRGRMFGPDTVFNNGQLADVMLPMQGRFDGFIPVVVSLPGSVGTKKESSCGCGCTGTTTTGQGVEVDENMSKRRVLNMQMRAAVEVEDFEKAAELRDKIKELETPN